MGSADTRVSPPPVQAPARHRRSAARAPQRDWRRPPVRPAGGPGQTRHWGDLAGATAGLGGGLAVGSALVVMRPVWATPGGPATVLGTLAAVAGTYLCLLLLVLISRLPWLEREVGHDRMLAWHRRAAPWSLVLIGAHVLFTTVGYSGGLGWSTATELWTIVTEYPWMVPAALAFLTMVVLGVISWRPIRRRMSYETWWVAHLYFYLAVALAFGHQINTGLLFAPHPQLRAGWIALYVAVAAAVVTWRLVLPVHLSVRHQLRVSHVVHEAPGVVSIYVCGRQLGELGVAGGQFFQWRFLTREWWWQAHPYSLSAVPTEDLMRITVKQLGDQSERLARSLHPGTRVIAEGPYGTFTAAARTGNRVVAFAAGVGITPIRALLDDIPASADVTVVYRVASLAKIPLADELEALTSSCGWRLVYLDGPRAENPITLNFLTQHVPELSSSDVYVCGPRHFSDAVIAAARRARVPDERLHYESFQF